MMKKGYYIKYFLYGLVFWVLVVSMLAFSNKEEIFILVCFSGFGLISALCFPFAVLLIERTCSAMIQPTHWGRWVGLVALIFAVPLGLLYFIADVIKKRNASKHS